MRPVPLRRRLPAIARRAPLRSSSLSRIRATAAATALLCAAPLATGCARLRGEARHTLPAAIPEVKGVARTQYVMRYIDVALGTGAEAAPGKTYVVHYTGWLTDGRKFDSSRDRNEPLRFEQGRRRVIPGWDAGFEGMRVGGRRRLFIPYQLAYGVPGRSPTIPPCAELIFDVELLGVEEPPPPTAPAPPRPMNPADSTRSCPR
jgi:peptidylprolyl isomerase